jgi:hypothetical protein
MFIGALFIISETWKQPRYLSVDEWINKQRYTQKMEYYSVLMRNVLPSSKKIWRKLKCILPGEISRSEKAR